ncbi:MAG: hypothetical protein ACTHNP_02375 [Solirubrobacterales bacterium]
MRAATVIVGALAFSSCLVALAFLLSGSNSGSSPRASAGAKSGRSHYAQVRANELTECNSNGGTPFSVEGVSCQVGEGVQRAYNKGFHDKLEGKDPKTGETIVVTCAGTAPVICRGEDGIKIYFAPAE